MNIYSPIAITNTIRGQLTSTSKLPKLQFSAIYHANQLHFLIITEHDDNITFSHMSKSVILLRESEFLILYWNLVLRRHFKAQKLIL